MSPEFFLEAGRGVGFPGVGIADSCGDTDTAVVLSERSKSS